jgi:lantibiotic modifying enzyme
VSFLETAASIGSRLCSEAVLHDGRCTWLGDDVDFIDGDWQVVNRTVGGELYSGTSGIAVFLARLHRLTGDAAAGRLALAGMRQALWLDADAPEASPGLYDGRSGVAWAAARTGELLGAEELIAASARLSSAVADEALRAGPGASASADLMSGAPGRLLALLSLSRLLNDERLEQAAVVLGRQLCSAARRSAAGWSWPAVSEGSAHLCGLAHGASGVAYALLELHARTGEPEFLGAAAEAARFERGWFDREACGWPDLRDGRGAGATTPAAYPVHWCHGAVGIGLVRLRAHQLTGDAVSLAEAGAALQGARRWAGEVSPPDGTAAADGDLSLCHGLGGAAELFVLAHELLGPDDHLMLARELGERGIAYAASNGGRWPCGIPGGGEAPGLMLGLAGIGAWYLRIHDPRSMPPIALPILATAGGR